MKWKNGWMIQMRIWIIFRDNMEQDSYEIPYYGTIKRLNLKN